MRPRRETQRDRRGRAWKIAEPIPGESRQPMKSLVICGILLALLITAALTVTLSGATQGFPSGPAQPIEFPHNIHISEVGLECIDCHQYVDRSIHAGLPDAELCMMCHEDTATDKPEVIKLIEMYEAGQPIEWVRVYEVEPHVYFSHRRHVLSDIECQDCHGPVEEMTTVQPVTNLEMGWCVRCHRTQGGPRECITCHT